MVASSKQQPIRQFEHQIPQKSAVDLVELRREYEKKRRREFGEIRAPHGNAWSGSQSGEKSSRMRGMSGPSGGAIWTRLGGALSIMRQDPSRGSGGGYCSSLGSLGLSNEKGRMLKT